MPISRRQPTRTREEIDYQYLLSKAAFILGFLASKRDENTRRIEPFDLVDEYFYSVFNAFCNSNALPQLIETLPPVFIDL